MTENEVLDLLAYAEQAWPHRPFDVEACLPVWTEALGDVDAGRAISAVKAAVKTSPFPPSISEIRSAAVPSWMDRQNRTQSDPDEDLGPMPDWI